MSLVNQMLRDLDKQPPNQTNIPLKAVKSIQENNKWPILAILSLLTIGITSYFVLLKSPASMPENKGSQNNLLVENRVQENQKLVPANSKATVLKTLPGNKSPKPSESVNNEKDLVSKNNINAKAPADEPIATKPFEKLAIADLKNAKDIQEIEEQRLELKTQIASQMIQLKPSVQESKQSRLNKNLQKIKLDSEFVNFSQTQQALLSLLSESPDFHAARLFLLQEAKENNSQHTELLIEQAIELYPNTTSYLMTASRYYFQLKQWHKAENYLLDVNREQSNYFELIQMRALIRQQMGKHKTALKDYAKILQQTPGRGDIHLAMGISWQALSLRTEARRSFQNALSDSRLNPQQRQFARAKIQQNQG